MMGESVSGDLDAAGQLIEAAAMQIEVQSETLTSDAETLLRDMGRVLERNYQAMELWRRWFARFGDPWFKAEDGELWCAFCDGGNKIHKRGCIYKAAERLVKG